MGRFGSPLGLKNIDFSLDFVGFRENSRFSTKVRFKSRLEPNLAHLGSILAPFWAPFWHPKRSKNDVENMLKFEVDFDRFLIDFWRL